MKQLALPFGAYVVVGGSCLAVRGIRDSKDIDIAVLPALFQQLQQQKWPLDDEYAKRWGRLRLKKGDVEIHPDMFLERENRFVDIQELIDKADIIEGVPFLSLQHLRMFKQDSGRQKDMQDIAALDALQFS